MTKISQRPLPKEDWEEYFDQICNALTLFETKKDIRYFLNDLWTYTEKKMFSKRLQIARQLLRNQTYEDISRRLNVTANTITSISEVLNTIGDGFRRADESLSEIEEEKREKLRRAVKRSENPFAARHLKNRGSTIGGAGEAVVKKIKRRKRVRSVKKG